MSDRVGRPPGRIARVRRAGPDRWEIGFGGFRTVETICAPFQFVAFAGEMRVTFSLADADGGTEFSVLCEYIPKGVWLEDNEVGCRFSLQNLAAFLE